MTASGWIAIEATDARYYSLTHQPSGQPLDKDGRGVWPADQFTFRLIEERALREQGPEAVPAVSGTFDAAPQVEEEPAAADAAASPAKPRK